MAFGIFTVILSVSGLIYGVIKKNKPAFTVSAVLLIMTITVWVYFYYNPY